ncbi:MAG: hypothetical protein RJA81_734 [Planctomycetota bacterium]|jgi:endonuclease/exonuclease/phosphatase (EEP) superfamily protein YafD
MKAKSEQAAEEDHVSEKIIQKRSILHSLLGLFHAGVALAFFSAVLGYFGSYYFLIDLFSHFRLVYSLAFVLGIVVALLTSQKVFLRLWVLAFFINGFSVFSMFYPDSTAKADSNGHSLRVMTINVLRSNSEKQAVTDAILKHNPDILIAVEVDQPWARVFSEALSAQWPHALVDDRFDNYGVLIYSKFPLIQGESFESPMAYVPTIRAEVKLGEDSCVVYGVHTFPPMSDFNATALQSQLADIAQRVSRETKPVILMGDLNSTPWSAYFKRFLRNSGLVDSQQGFGPQSSWPTNLPYIGLPIDHVLISPEIFVKTRKIGSHNGSDHRPVYADLVIPKRIQ